MEMTQKVCLVPESTLVDLTLKWNCSQIKIDHSPQKWLAKRVIMFLPYTPWLMQKRIGVKEWRVASGVLSFVLECISFRWWMSSPSYVSVWAENSSSAIVVYSVGTWKRGQDKVILLFLFWEEYAVSFAIPAWLGIVMCRKFTTWKKNIYFEMYIYYRKC